MSAAGMPPRHAGPANRDARRRFPALAIAACLALAFAALLPFRGGGPLGARADALLAGSDFGAFYCAALVGRTGGDPYASAPLGACEERVVYAPGGTTLAAHGIDPAPLPAYALAAYALFTFLPYRIAGLLWIGMLVVALCVVAFGLRRLTGLPFAFCLASLAFGDGVVCFVYGQVQPFVSLGLVGAALALAARRDALAVACASVAFFEPQIGLPVMLALALFSRARLAAVAVMVALGEIGLCFGGPHASVEYFSRVLPVHAFSEIGIDIQYGLAALLHAASVPDAIALRVASVQYVATAGAGILLGARLARVAGRPTLVLVPAAAAVLGGTFMHVQEIASALPLALYLAGRMPATRPWSTAAVVLLALPWQTDRNPVSALFDVAVLAGAAALTIPRPTARRTAVAAAIALAAYAGAAFAIARLPDAPLRPRETPAAVAAAGFDPRLASTRVAIEWREPAASAGDGATIHALVERTPTWAGLLLVLGVALCEARRRGDPRHAES